MITKALAGRIFLILSVVSTALYLYHEDDDEPASSGSSDVVAETISSPFVFSLPPAVEHATEKEIGMAILPAEQKSAPEADSEEMEQSSVSEIINSADLGSASSLRRALHALTTRPQDQVAEFILDAFSRSTGAGVAREKLLWFAKRLGGETLFPLWKSVLLRENPRVFQEDLQANPYPSEIGALAGIEQLLAINALAAMDSSDAQNLLKDVAWAKGDTYEMTPVVRLEAVRELQARESRTLLLLARSLSADDPLRVRLAVWASQKGRD